MLPRIITVLLLLFIGCWGQWGALAVKLRDSRVVNTKYGALKGVLVTPQDKHLHPVDVFLGVPYASPPIGKLRFMPPVSPNPWPGTRSAVTFGAVCPQRLPDIANETTAQNRLPKGRLHYLKRLFMYLKNQSEDCLYLNIFAPVRVGNDYSPLPVMVFIHGESYEWNSGNPYDGTYLASFGEVVVVTINYRLGILGFLRTGHDGLRGNYGLLDQVGALTWIADNIKEFGGDEKNVTLIGQGHGAACINFLMVSRVAQGYFHRAILHSGSALSPWALVRNPEKYAQEVAKAVNCPTNSMSQLSDCLRERPLDDFNKVNIRSQDYLSIFGPTIDGVTILGEPQKLMKDYGDVFSKFDVIMGTTKVEVLSPFTAGDMQFGLEADRRDNILRTFLTSNYEYHLNEIFALLVNEYTDWTRSAQHPVNTRDATMEILGDALVVAPLVMTGNLHASHNRQKTFFYNFAYQSRDGDFPRRLGCFQGEELPYVFGAPFSESQGTSIFYRNYTKAEKSLSETVMTYWTNFAKTGDPNLSGTQPQDYGKNRSRFTKVVWPFYDVAYEKYLAIGIRPKVRNHYRAHKLSIWLRLIPLIHQEDKENTSPHHHAIFKYSNGTTLQNTTRKTISNFQENLHPSPTDRPLLPSQSSTLATHQPSEGKPSSTNNNEATEGHTISPTSDNSKNLTDRLKAEAIYHGSYSTALSVTIAVGCSLLILNILIFAGIYYQRDKNRLEAKLQKKNYKLKKVNEELGCQAAAMPPLPTTPKQTAGIVALPRAPPPSPVGQSSRVRGPPDFPSAAVVAQTLNTLKSPPKVPPKPSTTFVSNETNALTEAQPLLAQNATGNKLQSKNQKLQEIRV